MPANADPWLAVDKLEHFVFCATIVAAAYFASLRFLARSRAVSLSAAILLSVAAAGAKELGDYLEVVFELLHLGFIACARATVSPLSASMQLLHVQCMLTLFTCAGQCDTLSNKQLFQTLKQAIHCPV